MRKYNSFAEPVLDDAARRSMWKSNVIAGLGPDESRKYNVIAGLVPEESKKFSVSAGLVPEEAIKYNAFPGLVLDEARNISFEEYMKVVNERNKLKEELDRKNQEIKRLEDKLRQYRINEEYRIIYTGQKFAKAHSDPRNHDREDVGGRGKASGKCLL